MAMMGLFCKSKNTMGEEGEGRVKRVQGIHGEISPVENLSGPCNEPGKRAS